MTPDSAWGLPGANHETEKEKEPYFFLDRDAERDPAIRQVQDALNRNMPSIQEYLKRACNDESAFYDYVDRLYRRLKKAIRSPTELTEKAIWSRLVSLVHEDKRRDRGRFVSSASVEIEQSDPKSLDFVGDLVRNDQLRAFRECLDEWTRQAFDFRYSTPFPRTPALLAQQFGMKRNTFYQKWNRGIEAGLEEYRKRYDP